MPLSTAAGGTAERHSGRDLFQRLEAATDIPMAALALLIVPVLILEERATSDTVRTVAHGLNWLVWVAFCAEFLGKLAASAEGFRYVRRAWFDLLIIALSPPFLVPNAMQGVRAVRLVRLLRLLRFVRAAAVAAIGLREAGEALRRRRFHLVAVTTTVIVALGAIGIFAVENGQNDHIGSLGDAFWWAIVTTTTVGYGDVSPVTPEGRLIAVALMIVGIGFIGVFTASITSFFLEPEHASTSSDIEDRLERIEAQLAELLNRQHHL